MYRKLDISKIWLIEHDVMANRTNPEKKIEPIMTMKYQMAVIYKLSAILKRVRQILKQVRQIFKQVRQIFKHVRQIFKQVRLFFKQKKFV